jgi:hypothetical protein
MPDPKPTPAEDEDEDVPSPEAVAQMLEEIARREVGKE